MLNHKNFRKLDVIEKKSLFQAIENRNASNEGRKAYYIENIDKGDKKDQIYEKPKDNNIVVLNLKKNNSYVLLKAYYSSIEENEIIKNKKNKEQLTNNEKMNVRNTAINKMLNHQNDFNNDWRYKTFLFSEQRKFDEENKNADFEISDENKQNNILISEKFDEINGENKKQLINVSVGVAYNIAATIAKHKARKYGGYDAEAAIPMLEKNKIIFINKSQSITKQIIKHKGIDGGLNEDLNKMRLFGFALHFEDNVWFIFLKNNDKYYYISIKDPNGIGESIITISNFISTINTNDN